MKSTLLVAIGIFATLAGYAQTTTVGTEQEALKPQEKRISTELNVNPFNGQVNLNNSLNQIKLRYFVKNDVALRFGFNVNRKDTVASVNNPYGPNGYFSRDDRKSTQFALNAGIEKHFTGTRRLSPYIGLDLTYSSRSASQQTDNNSSSTTVKNGWYVSTVSGNVVYSAVQQAAYTRYGASVFTGFDFYIAKHFFFGYELNFTLSKTDWKNVEITQTATNIPSTNSNAGRSSSVNFGPTLLNGIRIGYTF
ncbi:hypothetical protein MUY27_00795 [Mucilaginibacter sp. RS28]|uniref:Outer membrane protein beta-barrel domain-containing protein n=1 Tax=Mucilaginibacter straminoryzae TaxID=2932774 RepID=A0A9X1WZD6_9SPHI|nr:hypothetical protein [Mucilaginibacter straminoryzae]MCJ8208223.1 hypothetical protein [Mucilaginibacter straminoryzae]